MIQIAPCRFIASWTLAAAFALSVAPVWGQTTFSINSLSDNANQTPGNGNCDTGAWGGTTSECTLRAAIEEANETTGAVVIDVSPAIPTNSNGLSNIIVETPFPVISNQVTIAGETHPEFTEDENYKYLVIIGANDISSGSGLFFTTAASGSVVRHIAIGRFNGNGITVGGGSGYTVRDNTVGISWNETQVGGIGNASDGIVVATNSVADSVVLNNVVGNNDGHGITISASSSSVLIAGNVVGLRPPLGSEPTFLPTEWAGNGGDGIHVTPNADNNIIGNSFFGGNVVSNNAGGIRIRADDNVIRANRIGISHPDGVAPSHSESDYGNEGNALTLEGSGNIVGGADEANIIGNAALSGIRIGSTGTTPVAGNDNVIDVNYIGTDPSGADIGQTEGIRVENGTGNLILGATIAFNSNGIDVRSDSSSTLIRRNTIVDNSSNGVRFLSSGNLGTVSFSDANVIGNNNRGVRVSAGAGSVSIRRNYIGTDASGADLGNSTGIQINGSNPVNVGLSGTGNVIGNSNGSGIFLSSNANNVWILGNHIGIHPNGTPIGNGRGISFSGASNGNRIGFSSSANIDPDAWQPGSDAGNIIAHNSDAGVMLTSANDGAVANVVRGNRFFGNNGTAIDLGMTELDPGGGAIGPNEQMNFPDFDAGNTQFDFATGTLNYRYRVQTTPANADYPLVIDFYLADGESAEGLTFIGSESYPDTSAFEFVSGSLSLDPGLASGGYLIATATDASGNTSQFSLDPIFLDTLEDEMFSDRFEAN
jgi:CSLREA domain-containing protein